MSDPQDLDEMIQTTVAELMDERDSWSPEAVQYVLEKAIRLALDHRAVWFTAAEIEFIDKAEADYTTAQNLIEKRLGYRP